MKSTLFMDFSVDRENKQIKVQREFAAPVEKAWAAWTESRWLDQWWAPKPWKTVTKSMDFREGGRWLYAMVGPEDETHWCCADYSSITPHEGFRHLDAFCDKEGNLNADFPRTQWTTTFRASGPSTMVTVVLSYQSLADLEKILELGFKEGFTMAMENLDEVLG